MSQDSERTTEEMLAELVHYTNQLLESQRRTTNLVQRIIDAAAQKSAANSP